ncbi:MAG: ABC transporter ATP-binding protein [Oscillospiraceae bacterium]|nr:ABC transporter ATP-binding protein [Oscillospiraceae bacterium]
MSSNTLLQIKRLEKKYPRVMALDDVDFEVTGGKIIGLLGPNMSGKTTLLKSIAGLVTPDRGEIIYPNNVTGIDRLKTFSFLPDTLSFPAYMKVRDAFTFYSDMHSDFCGETAEKLAIILELPMDRVLKKLSKGMQERVSLALTFARKVPLYLLDEPLGGIDPLGKTKIMEAILTAPDEDSTILLSTHLVKDVENIFDSVVFIRNGKIIFSGDCDEIRETHNKTVEQLYIEMFTQAAIYGGGVL